MSKVEQQCNERAAMTQYNESSCLLTRLQRLVSSESKQNWESMLKKILLWHTQVAEEVSFSVSKTEDRAVALRESLADELEEARLVTEAAEAARKRAQHNIDQAQEELANLQKEEQTRKVR